MSAGWADGPMTPFDLETGGIDVENDRIVTACVAHIRPGREVDKHRWLIAVDQDIDPEATQVHGITTEYAREHGRPAAEVLTELTHELASGWDAGAPVVGHNIGGFDLALLDRECRRWLGLPLRIDGPVVDTLCLDRSKRIGRYRKGGHRLEALAKHYSVTLAKAHDELEDALASARIAWRMCRQYPWLAAMTFEQLMAYQAEQHVEWAEHFETYKREQLTEAGEPPEVVEAFVIPREWPMQTIHDLREAA